MFNTFGLLLFYWGEILDCKVEALVKKQSQQHSKSLIVFISNSSDFIVIDNKEILFNGKLFDIIKKEIKNGETYFYTVSDEKEDNAVKGIERLTKNNLHHRTLPTKVPVHLVLKYLPTGKLSNLKDDSYLFTLTLIDLQNTCLFYQSPDRTIFSPPPESTFT